MAANKLSKEQREDLCDRYLQGENSAALSKAFGVAPGNVCKLLARRGIPRRSATEAHRTKTLRQDAFAQVTDESAYWVGFLMADGTVRNPTKPYTRYIVRLALASKDRGHILKFKEFLGSSHKITFDNCRGIGSFNHTGKYVLAVHSEQMYKDLLTYGVGPNKTLTAVVSANLANNAHFWRGMIDGDGSIYVRKADRKGAGIGLGLCGTEALMLQFKFFIQQHYPSFSGGVHKAKGKPLWTIAVAARAAECIIDVLYKDCPIGLDRKVALANEIVCNTESRQPTPCEYCGGVVAPSKRFAPIRFCSSLCRSRFRGLADPKDCQYCGAGFTTHKGRNTLYCSISCGQKARRQREKELLPVN